MGEATRLVESTKMHKGRLFVKFAAISVFLIALTIVGLAAVSIYRQKTIFEREWRLTRLDFARVAETSFANAIQLNDFAFLEEFNNKISQQKELLFSGVVDAEMVFLVHSDSTKMGQEADNDLLRQSALTRKPLLEMHAGADWKGTVCDVAVPIIVADEVKGVGYLRFSAGHLDRMAADLYKEFGLLAAIFLSLGVVGALFMAKSVVGPVVKLANIAENVARGDFGVRCSLDRKDELGVLANSFDSMVERLKIARSQLENAKEAVERKLRFETFISTMSSRFLQERNISEAIEKSLAEIGQITETDAAYLFLTNEDKTTVSDSFEWINENYTSNKNAFQKLPIETLPWFFKKMKAGESVECIKPEELPEKASALKRMLDDIGTEGMLVVPLTIDGEFAGFLGLDYKTEKERWPEDYKPFMQLIATVFGRALERKKAEEIQRKLEAQSLVVKELKEIDQLKNEFVETVTHELRTPMTPLRSAAELLITGTFGEVNPKQREYLEMMQRNIERLSRFATDVLSISRLESGKYPIHVQKISILSVIKPAVELLKKKSEEKKSTLSLDIMHDTHAFGDPDAISEVVTNLVNNAIVHTPEGTEIKVSTRNLSDDFVEITVQDNGQGIEDEALEKIFDRFVQVGRKSGPGYRGSGIGLAVCKALVDSMGGKISVKSKTGAGTTFKFSLPKITPEQNETPEEKVENGVETGG